VRVPDEAQVPLHGMDIATGKLMEPSMRNEIEMRENKTVRVNANGALAGTTWFAGWLFTIGFAKLVWWKALLGLVAWPYFLALALR
jgi:hypothetical protein